MKYLFLALILASCDNPPKVPADCVHGLRFDWPHNYPECAG